MFNNLSVSQYFQLFFLSLSVALILAWYVKIHVVKKMLEKYIPIQIINSAFLPHTTLFIEPKYSSENYKAVYLIQYSDYDAETIAHQSLNTLNREYKSHSIGSAEYIIVNTEDTQIYKDKLTAIEDNYSKAILLISQADEYYYLDIKYPSRENTMRLKSRHNNREQRRLSKDELPYYRVLGTVVSRIQSID